MIVTSDYLDIPAQDSPMRLFVAAPKQEGRYPGILAYSDIFQLTGPMIRACVRLASYGFVVAAPEIYHRIEPPGSAIAFDDAGRTRGLDDALKTAVSEFDADARTTLDWLAADPRVAPGQFGVMGFCIGGHLAFRASFNADVKATTCFYGTGIHNGKLGKDADSGSLARCGDIRGDLLMVWGESDPHIPSEGRATIHFALDAAGTNYTVKTFPAEHAFMRDEGPRYDAHATDLAFAEMIAFYGRVFGK